MLKIIKYTLLSVLGLIVICLGVIIYAFKVDHNFISVLQGSDRVSLPDTARSLLCEVTYSQPHKNNRVIFGGLVPYGKVWRTGANEATEVTFKKDAIFGDKSIKAGTYTLFTIPQKNKWTIILNSQTEQWGAFDYNEYKMKDVLHTDVPVQHVNIPQELFTIKLTDTAMLMTWDSTNVLIPMKF